VGAVFTLGLSAYICFAALSRPYVGLIGYFGWAILKPEYLWAWSLPQDLGLQKYIAIATFLGWALQGFPGNSIRGSSLLACLGLVIYLLLSWVSSFQSHDPVQTGFFMSVIWKIVLMTILAARLLDTPEKINALMWVAVLGQGLNAYEINMQYFRDGYAWALEYGWGFFDNNTYSILTVPIIAFSASLALVSRHTWQKMLAGGVLILQVHQTLLLESRGCMLGLVAFVAILWSNVPKTPARLLAGIGMLVVVSILAGPPVVKEFDSTFASESNRDESAESRFSLWQAGWEITKDYPLLGLGPWGAETTVPLYYPGGLDAGRKALHNLFFELTTGSGVPAAIAYLTFLWVPWFAMRRRCRQARGQLSNMDQAVCLSVIAGVPAFWVSSMFSSGILLESGYLCIAIAIATLSTSRAGRPGALSRSIAIPGRGAEPDENLGIR
jgi:O-antigen ligase